MWPYTWLKCYVQIVPQGVLSHSSVHNVRRTVITVETNICSCAKVAVYIPTVHVDSEQFSHSSTVWILKPWPLSRIETSVYTINPASIWSRDRDFDHLNITSRCELAVEGNNLSKKHAKVWIIIWLIKQTVVSRVGMGMFRQVLLVTNTWQTLFLSYSLAWTFRVLVPQRSAN